MSDIVQRMRDAAARNKPAYCLDAAGLRALADLVEAGRRWRDGTGMEMYLQAGLMLRALARLDGATP